jgi:hypothetical protein
MPAKKVRVVGQGGNGGKDDWTKEEYAQAAFGGRPAADAAYQKRMAGVAEQTALDAAKAKALDVPDLTADAVKGAIAAGYRSTSIARRSRANSFQVGETGFVNQGNAKGVLDLPKPGSGVNMEGVGIANPAPGSAVTSNDGESPLNAVRRRAKAAGF